MEMDYRITIEPLSDIAKRSLDGETKVHETDGFFLVFTDKEGTAARSVGGVYFTKVLVHVLSIAEQVMDQKDYKRFLEKAFLLLMLEIEKMDNLSNIPRMFRA